VLILYTRERVPLAWAATQNNLGGALLILGQRERGTARLDEAVVAYREALKERTRPATCPISDSPAVRSPDQEREALPVTSDEKGTLPIARRRKR